VIVIGASIVPRKRDADDDAAAADRKRELRILRSLLPTVCRGSLEKQEQETKGRWRAGGGFSTGRWLLLLPSARKRRKIGARRQVAQNASPAQNAPSFRATLARDCGALPPERGPTKKSHATGPRSIALLLHEPEGDTIVPEFLPLCPDVGEAGSSKGRRSGVLVLLYSTCCYDQQGSYDHLSPLGF
jgi:hypothetical protein